MAAPRAARKPLNHRRLVPISTPDSQSLAKRAIRSSAGNMISLKTYLLGDSDKEVETSYRRMFDLFLQGISLHAVEGDQSDYERFRSDMNAFGARLAPTISMAERFMVVGEVLRALEDYNRHTSKFLRIQNAELQNMIAMLTQTVIAVGTNSETSVAGLQQIEKALERTRMVEDVQLVKAQLGECLKSVRGESERQKADGQAALDSIRQELAQSQERMGGMAMGPQLDPATGLPGKVEAEKGLQKAAASPGNKFLLLAVVNRLEVVNARFGVAIGDQALAVAAEHFRGALPAVDTLYRWQGPVLVAILSRTAAIDTVRAEVQRFAERKLEKSFSIGSRSVMLPISASWAIFPIVFPMDALLRKVETFIAAQKSQDHV
jgi:GGDEF domain-containing protein